MPPNKLATASTGLDFSPLASALNDASASASACISTSPVTAVHPRHVSTLPADISSLRATVLDTLRTSARTSRTALEALSDAVCALQRGDTAAVLVLLSGNDARQCTLSSEAASLSTLLHTASSHARAAQEDARTLRAESTTRSCALAREAETLDAARGAAAEAQRAVLAGMAEASKDYAAAAGRERYARRTAAVCGLVGFSESVSEVVERRAGVRVLVGLTGIVTGARRAVEDAEAETGAVLAFKVAQRKRNGEAIARVALCNREVRRVRREERAEEEVGEERARVVAAVGRVVGGVLRAEAAWQAAEVAVNGLGAGGLVRMVGLCEGGGGLAGDLPGAVKRKAVAYAGRWEALARAAEACVVALEAGETD